LRGPRMTAFPWQMRRPAGQDPSSMLCRASCALGCIRMLDRTLSPLSQSGYLSNFFVPRRQKRKQESDLDMRRALEPLVRRSNAWMDGLRHSPDPTGSVHPMAFLDVPIQCAQAVACQRFHTRRVLGIVTSFSVAFCAQLIALITRPTDPTSHWS
jgi:hypothetical protein